MINDGQFPRSDHGRGTAPYRMFRSVPRPPVRRGAGQSKCPRPFHVHENDQVLAKANSHDRYTPIRATRCRPKQISKTVPRPSERPELVEGIVQKCSTSMRTTKRRLHGYSELLRVATKKSTKLSQRSVLCQSEEQCQQLSDYAVVFLVI